MPPAAVAVIELTRAGLSVEYTDSMPKAIRIADLFCGAGGTSQGAVEAVEALGYRAELTAINHWAVAVATHTANHPGSRHLCASLDAVNPRDLYGDDELDLLWASPECTHHSVARGGKPINDQSRATAWCVVRWAEALRPAVILVENVKEFLTWGPLIRKRVKGKLEWVPDPKHKGEIFHSWVKNLEAIGYRVEWRMLCAADYGDPTTRKRLFIYAVRGRRKIIWPEPTHAAPNHQLSTLNHQQADLVGGKRMPWRTAREIIDWTVIGKSIYTRKKPLAAKTLERIYIGLQRFGLAPFMVPQHRGGDPVRSLEMPVPAITTTSRGVGIAQPFLVELRGDPIDHSKGSARSLDDPMPTLTAGGTHLGLAQPYLVQTNHGNGAERAHPGRSSPDSRRTRPLTDPLPTVAGNRGEWALCEPFLVEYRGTERTRSVDDPTSTVTAGGNHLGLVQPFIIPHFGERNGQRPRTHSVDDPLPTVTSHGAGALVQPYLVKYFGTGGARPVTEPLDSVTTKPRFGLVQPNIELNGEKYRLDIHFRMLKWRELARAQGFHDTYQFTGTSTDIIKQIGNAVPRKLACALVRSALSQQP